MIELHVEVFWVVTSCSVAVGYQRDTRVSQVHSEDEDELSTAVGEALYCSSTYSYINVCCYHFHVTSPHFERNC
jgi:hypothetical protein